MGLKFVVFVGYLTFGGSPFSRGGAVGFSLEILIRFSSKARPP